MNGPPSTVNPASGLPIVINNHRLHLNHVLLESLGLIQNTNGGWMYASKTYDLPLTAAFYLAIMLRLRILTTMGTSNPLPPANACGQVNPVTVDAAHARDYANHLQVLKVITDMIASAMCPHLPRVKNVNVFWACVSGLHQTSTTDYVQSRFDNDTANGEILEAIAANFAQLLYDAYESTGKAECT